MEFSPLQYTKRENKKALNDKRSQYENRVWINSHYLFIFKCYFYHIKPYGNFQPYYPLSTVINNLMLSAQAIHDKMPYRLV